jgi:hypothetical protein
MACCQSSSVADLDQMLLRILPCIYVLMATNQMSLQREDLPETTFTVAAG